MAKKSIQQRFHLREKNLVSPRGSHPRVTRRRHANSWRTGPEQRRNHRIVGKHTKNDEKTMG